MKQTSLEMQNMVYKRIAEYKQLVASDPYRLHYHLMPPIGLLNDPNGFVFFRGHYHVFYQWNPFETTHGAKFWGHYVSDDLVHWVEAPIALAPDSWYDKNGCYSGSTVVHDDKMYVFYTGNVKNQQDERESYQCLAISEDGVTFEKKGPVIEVPDGYTAHFRDPKVFQQNDRWYMVLGAQTMEEKGEAVLYSSSNLLEWNFEGSLAGSGKNGLGEFGYMWECPDFITVDGQDILLVCPQGLTQKGYDYQNIFQSGYFAGRADMNNVTFHHGEFHELDHGFDFYAPQTTKDAKGRHLLFGWMGNAEEEGVIQPTVQHEWIHALTIPRSLTWQNGRLIQQPVEELKQLRTNEIRYVDTDLSNIKLAGGEVFEMLLEFHQWEAKNFKMKIGNTTSITYDAITKTLILERQTFQAGELEQRYCVIEQLQSLHVFKDTSSLEIFVNDGERVLSSRVFDNSCNKDITFHVNGMVEATLSKWDLNRVTAY